MTNIASQAKGANYGLVERRINVLQAIENAKIDRSETCFKGFGYLAHEDLAQYMEALEEEWAETPW